MRQISPRAGSQRTTLLVRQIETLETQLNALGLGPGLSDVAVRGSGSVTVDGRRAPDNNLSGVDPPAGEHATNKLDVPTPHAESPIGEEEPAAMDHNLARVETELATMREEIAALRATLARAQQDEAPPVYSEAR